jgi:ABC-type bacteriocin/lantibiotic exporter with double-glycine peptidase domain
MVVDGLIVAGSLMALLLVAPTLLWIALAVLPLYAAYLVRALSRVGEAQGEVLAAYSAAEASFIDHMRGIADIISTGSATVFSHQNRARIRDFQYRAERLGRLQATVNFASDLTGGTILAAALAWGAL